MARLGLRLAGCVLSCLGLSMGGASVMAAVDLTANDSRYLEEEMLSLNFLWRNVSVSDGAPGAIVAAPSRDKPNYYYHWVRDAAIALRSLIAEYETTANPARKQALQAFFRDHIDFNLKIQATALSDGVGLGEARFTLHGGPVPGPWGSPQQDGPALRVIEFTHLAKLLLAEGDTALVRGKLYDGRLPSQSLLKRDLEYLAHSWHETSFDIWEELKAHHFYTRLLTWKALRAGADLAASLGDAGAATYYAQQAQELATTLGRHWQPWRGYLVEALDPDVPSRIRTTGLDSAVVVAVLTGYGTDDPFPVTDERVVATVLRLEQVFHDLYPINDPDRSVAGIAIGRYPEDRYDGTDINGIGHPWPFLTANFALYYYRFAQALKAHGQLQVTPQMAPFLAALALNEVPAVGSELTAGSCAFDEVYRALLRKADGYIARVQSAQASDGSLSEQNDRMTGLPISAPSLSMSYAAYVIALRARLSAQGGDH